MSSPLNKKQLYNLVWQKPIMEVAKEYGLSDRGLGKLCERHGIPVPPRGYWAKIYAGQKIKKPPLIALDLKEAETIVLIKRAEFQARESKLIEPNKLPPEIQQAIDREALPANLIKVSKTLNNPHPIVANWITEECRQQELYSRLGQQYNWLKPNKLKPRKRRIISALLKALESRGFKVETDHYRREFWVVQGLDKIQFSVNEHIRQYRRELTEAEKADHWNKNSKWKQVSEETGFLKLRLFIDAWRGKIDFLETISEPLESQLNNVVAKIIEHLWYIKKDRLKREGEEHERWLCQQELQKQAENAELEQKRKGQLLQDSINWKHAQNLRDYIQAADKSFKEGKLQSTTEEFERWKKWALAYVEELDPLVLGKVLK